MEEFLFRLTDVSRRLDQLVEARLHTDGSGKHREKSLENQALQDRLTDTVATPIYVLIDPATEATLAIFEGATRDPEEFIEWLKSGAGLD